MRPEGFRGGVSVQIDCDSGYGCFRPYKCFGLGEFEHKDDMK